MTTSATIPDQIERTTTPTVIARRRYELFLLVLVGLPAIFLLSSIVIARSSAFPKEAGDPFLLNPDYVLSLDHADCGILIYGDSTAATGIDPVVVTQATGLKTCNIAQSQSILEVVGPVALDTYLKNNQPPKYLVIQLAPETLSRKQDFFWPEGLTMLLRRRPLPIALFTMVRHPVESYNFALWAVRTRILASFYPLPDFRKTEAIFSSHSGLLILPKPPESACIHDVAFAPPVPAWVDQLRQRYSVNGTKVLINIAPLPDCAKDVQRIADSMKNITDNSLEVYPIHLFCDLDRHLTMEGAERSSQQIAKQILALEKRPRQINN